MSVPPVETLPSHDDLDGVVPPQATLKLFGHIEPWRELTASAAGGKLHHGWLFQGPQGIGKATAAFAFARHLFAQPAQRSDEPASDLKDPMVRQVAQDTFPGLVHLTRPPVERGSGFRTQITVEEVRKLNRFFQATASAESWRVAIVDPADDMNASAANALLKMLEEPPARSVFIVINHTPGRLLPTIRSRCRLLRFAPLEDGPLGDAIAASLPGADPDDVQAAIPAAEGSVRQAMTLIANGGTALRRGLGDILAADRPDWNAIHALADQMTAKGREQSFELAVQALLGAVAKAAEDSLQAGDREGAARLSVFWQAESRRIREAIAYNLDRKQILLTLFDGYYRNHSALRRAA